MEKMKYILVITISLIAGIIIGWLVFSGSSAAAVIHPGFPVVRVLNDTVFADTVKVKEIIIKRDTAGLKGIDTVFVIRRDTVYPFIPADTALPLKIGENLFLCNSFELSFPYYYRTDTIIPHFSFPEMTAGIIHKHGRDSVMIVFKEIYRDYWYNNIYVELAKGLLIMAAGYYLHGAGDGCK